MNENVEIKILEPILHYAKEFISPEEFNLYYKIHKDEMDKLTTHKLNKLYHIKDYRITKIKGELMLKKFNEEAHRKIMMTRNDAKLRQFVDNDNDDDNNDNAEKITELERRIDIIEAENKNEIERINEEIKSLKIVLQSVRDFLVSQQ